MCASAVAVCLAVMGPCCCVCWTSIKPTGRPPCYGSVHVPSMAGLTAVSLACLLSCRWHHHHVGLEVLDIYMFIYSHLGKRSEQLTKPLCRLLAALRLAQRVIGSPMDCGPGTGASPRAAYQADDGAWEATVTDSGLGIRWTVRGSHCCLPLLPRLCGAACV